MLSDEFSLILEGDGVYKSYSLLKERGFFKLGYARETLFDCPPQFQNLLERTSKNKLVVKACRLHLESDFLMTGLKALTNFTYPVTMPFMNCVKRVDQNALCSIIPNILQESQNGNLICDNMKPFHVK